MYDPGLDLHEREARLTRSSRRPSAMQTTSRRATSRLRSTAIERSSTISSRHAPPRTESSTRQTPKTPDPQGYAATLMDAPPYSAAAVDVLWLPVGTTEPDRVAV